MALIPCQECGKKISDKASACTNCGAPVPVKIKDEEAASLSEDSSPQSPLAPCRICEIEVLRKAYVCPNCGIRNPDIHKNRATNTGLFLFIFMLFLADNYDTWPRLENFLPKFWVSVVILICIGWLWCVCQKLLDKHS